MKLSIEEFNQQLATIDKAIAQIAVAEMSALPFHQLYALRHKLGAQSNNLRRFVDNMSEYINTQTTKAPEL